MHRNFKEADQALAKTINDAQFGQMTPFYTNPCHKLRGFQFA